MSNKKAVAEKEAEEASTALANVAMFEEDAGEGVAMGKEDVQLPRLKILQGNKVGEGQQSMPGIADGDFYNDATLDFFKGSEGIKVIPCVYQRRFLRWPAQRGSAPPIAEYLPEGPMPTTLRDGNNKDIITHEIDGEKCDNGEYLEETHNHYVLLLLENGMTQMACHSMKKTGLKPSRAWNSLVGSRVAEGKNGPFTPARYSHVYKLETFVREKDGNRWAQVNVTLDSSLIEDNRVDLYKKAKDFANAVTAGEVSVKHEGEEEIPNTGNTEGDLQF